MLKYVGAGSSLPNIPARDLTNDEVKQFDKDFLLKSGLYVEDTLKYEPAKRKGTPEAIDERN